eukprot:scaffold64407_cov24-Tisochrysis_lutea.AAC.2
MSATSASDQNIDSCRSSQAPTALFTSSTAVTPCTAAMCSSHSVSEPRRMGEKTVSQAEHADLVKASSSALSLLPPCMADGGDSNRAKTASAVRCCSFSSSPTSHMSVRITSGSAARQASASRSERRRMASRAARGTTGPLRPPLASPRSGPPTLPSFSLCV